LEPGDPLDQLADYCRGIRLLQHPTQPGRRGPERSWTAL